MKLQGLGVIFAIIILPIAVILSYYIQMQVDTINLQTSYDSKIIDATHDALSALEINTANEKLSDVSDSLRSIIEASNSIFFNTLLTNFGLSNGRKALLEPYVPAILYTLYDGYYIYSDSESPEIRTWIQKEYDDAPDDQKASISVGQPKYDSSGQLKYFKKPRSEFSNDNDYYADDNLTPNINEAYMKTEYMLKSYMPYSARYNTGDIDITINYTLDNYLNIAGNVNGVYYTKTGYLFDPDSVEYVDVNFSNFNEQQAEEFIASGEHNVSINVKIPLRDEEGEISKISNPDSGYTAKLSVMYDLEDHDDPDYQKTYSYQINKFLKDKEDPSDPSQPQYATLVGINLNANSEYVVNGEYIVSLEGLQELERVISEHYQTAKAEQIAAEQIAESATLSYDIDKCNQLLQIVKPKIQMIQAVQYYVRNKIFSEWVYDNLNDIKESDIDTTETDAEIAIYQGADSQYVQQNKDLLIYKDFKRSYDSTYEAPKIFGDRHQDTEINSVFINHKNAVIRNSIIHNLNLSFTTHTKKSHGLVYELPIMTESEWDKITKSVSVVSYIGGMPCGSKIYSNYAVVSSSNNESTAIPEELYYVKSSKYNDENSELHRIDCEKYMKDLEVADNTSDSTNILNNGDITEPNMISIRSKDIKYDRLYNKNSGRAEYDTKNLTCYDCIVNNNNRFYSETSEYERGTAVINFKELMKKLGKNPDGTASTPGTNSQKALYREYYIGVACQRQDLYKTNAFTKSEGYETPSSISFDIDSNIELLKDSLSVNLNASKKVRDIKALEIVIDKLRYEQQVITKPVADITVKHNGINIGHQVLNVNKSTRLQTIRLDIDPNLLSGEISSSLNLTLTRDTAEGHILGKIVGVRVIYK